MNGSINLPSGLSSMRGQSLVQLLVGIAILSVVMLGMASVISGSHREVRAISEKLAALDLEKMLISSMSDGAVCGYVLNNPAPLKFNSTGPFPQTITLPNPGGGKKPALYSSILSGPAPGPIIAEVGSVVQGISSTLTVSSIELQITEGSSGSYKANWLVSFDDSKLVRGLKPVSVSTLLTVDDSNPAQATISSCSGGVIKGQTEMPYYRVYWDMANTCQSNPVTFDKSIAGTYTSSGEIFVDGNWRPYGAIFFEMKVRAPSATKVIQYLNYVDDTVAFWLNGALIWSTGGAGGYNNAPITWNLVAGENLIQVVHSDCHFSAQHEGLGLIGDFFSRYPQLEFVP